MFLNKRHTETKSGGGEMEGVLTFFLRYLPSSEKSKLGIKGHFLNAEKCLKGHEGKIISWVH